MIQFDDVSLRRGNKVLVEHASLTLHPGWHVGLTGRNGTGKSSLFALLNDELQADTGDVFIPPDWQIAHMEQEIDALDQPAIEYVIDGDQALRALQQDLEQAEQQEDNHRIANLHQALSDIDAYRAESKAAKLMTGLGFSQHQLKNNVRDFSGGWRMRLNLAKTLMCRSDLLLLDEPTNHLDLDAILWLEQWIQQYPGTALIISHDREFLDKTITHVINVEHQKLDSYTGNYSQFETIRAERLALQQAHYEKQQREIAHMQSFVDRFKAKATKAKQAQSRVKALERMEKIAPAHVDSPFTFSFREPDKCPNPLIRLDHADIGYGDTRILNDVEFSISPDTRLGLLGPNGAGKSTLIKSLVGDIPLLGGVRHLNEHLKVGYFAQHQLDQLDAEATPLLCMQRIAPNLDETRARTYLGSFGFTNDTVNQIVGSFSGGEKSRLALAILIWHKPNLLLLDEPTNHLDMEMRYALMMALQNYQGGLVLVSHDRHLIRSTTDELMLVADGKVRLFKDDLDAYAQWLAQQQSLNNTNQRNNDTTNNTPTAKVDKKLERQKAAELRKQLSPLKNRCTKLEKQLDQLNSEKDALETALASPDIYDAANKDKMTDLLQKQVSLTQTIQSTENEWLDALDTLENLQKSIG